MTTYNQTLTLTVESEHDDNDQMILALEQLQKDLQGGCRSGILGCSCDSWEITTDESED